MAHITLGGAAITTSGKLPEIGTKLIDFKLVAVDLSTKSLSDFNGSNIILNIFPSVNTGVCAASVRAFNETAASLENTKVLCVSRDLPFAQEQFCAAEGLENVIMLSDFKSGAFGQDYGVTVTGSAFDGLHSRCLIVADVNGNIIHTEQVSEIANEPNYKAALKVLS